MSSEAPPTWEQFDALYARIERVEAALAVAREREQRLREALEAIATLRLDEGLTTEQAMARARIQMQTFARAALVDEPAAATLAEPGAEADKGASASAVSGSVRTPPGSASAAADEPLKVRTAEESAGKRNLRVAADEPGETP